MGLSWNFFVARRGINVAEFFEKNNIRTYDEFAELLAGRGVDAPSQSSVSDLFVKHAPGAPDLWDAFRPPKHDTDNEADQAPTVIIEKDQDEQIKKEQPVTITKKNKAVAKSKQKKKAPKRTAQKAKSKAKTTTKKKRIPTKN
tara:strand:+ start:20297 stop:20725 length:429 start_codon:yes stop_codon:yes gene_type:complete